MTADADTDTNVDNILSEVGSIGLYQIITYLLICIPCALSASYQVSYMFSANTLNYRCKVSECDISADNQEIQYDQPWLHYAIPHSNGKLSSCSRYAPSINRNESSGLIREAQCRPEMFDTSKTVECTEFIYTSDEKNVQTEFNIHCSDSYDLALVGMVSNIGRFIFLPITGLLSDRFGRLRVVVIGLVCGSIFGLIKSFSTTYLMFLIFEFLESFGTSTFAGTFVLAIEWVHSKYRVLGSMIVSLAYPCGEILLGLVAMYVHDFRWWIRFLYAPGLLLIVYLWIVPESIRWLLSVGKVDRAIGILRRTASVNGNQLSDKSIEILKSKYSKESKISVGPIPEKALNEKTSLTSSLHSVFTSKTLFIRFVTCCYLYFASSFCYYGLSMGALNIPGVHQYLSFILVVAIEIPGILIAIYLLKQMKRRKLMFNMLFLTAVSVIVTPLIPKDQPATVMVSYLVAKASISCTYNSVYVYSAEMWPTNIRTTVLNFCSMIGKVGPMIAPMAAILATQYESLPAILFGTTAVVGALLALLCPETFEKKLPDTIQEAKDLNKSIS